MAKTYFFSCMELDIQDGGRAVMHAGLAVGDSVDEVREDIEGNFCDPKYISITEADELVPIFNEEGDATGFTDVTGEYFIGFDGIVKSHTCGQPVDN